MKLSRTNVARGYPIALLAAGVLSTTAIFIRYLTQNYALPALVLAFWREWIVTLTLLPVLGFLHPVLLTVERRHLRYLFAYGFLLSIFNALWTLSVALNGAAISTVLVYCSAGFTALLGWRLLKERLGWAKLLAVALGLGGSLFVSGAYNLEVWRSNMMGIFAGVLSGLCYAIYSVMGRSASQRGLNPWTTLLYTFGVAGVFLLLFNLLLGSILPGGATHLSDFIWLGDAVVGWLILFALAAGPTLLGYGLYNVSLTYLPSSVANLIVTLEPVFTAIIAYLLLNERLNPAQLVGGAMILTGVVLLRLYEGRETTPEQHAEINIVSAE